MESQTSFFSLQQELESVNSCIPSKSFDSSILDSYTLLRLHKPKRSIFYRNHRCNCSWCPKCYRLGTFKKIKGRISKYKWENTRHVVLTVDRNKFKDGRDAWEKIQGKKSIAQMIWNLKRVRKIKIERWLWVQEWHHDGFPHWHVLIQTKNRGMIGGDLLREYWDSGIWIREGFFKNKEHWNNVVGYFERKGYFEKGKRYQSELPEWARGTNIRIRRFGSSVEKDEGKLITIVKNKMEGEKMGKEREPKIYEVRFKECGAFTMVSIDSPFMGIGYMVEIPFKEFDRFMKGEYQPGMGYMVMMDDLEVEVLIDLCEKHQAKEGEEDDSYG